MQFEGHDLCAKLEAQPEPVDVYLPNGAKAAKVPARDTLVLAKSGAYVGVGNVGRVRYLRPLAGLVSASSVHNGSRTTQRIRNDAGVIIAAKPFVEHKPVPRGRSVKGRRGPSRS